MHSVLAEVARHMTPDVTPEVMRGLAKPFLKGTNEYIRRVARRTFHEAIPGLTFENLTVCTPHEEYMEATRKRGNRRTYDVARSDLYMVRLDLSFQGQPLPPKYMYLPYVGDGGVIHLSGSIYHLMPVLTNKVISPGNKSLFVRTLSTRKNFFRAGYSIRVNGVSKTTFVTHAQIYASKEKKQSMPPTTKAVSCMVHYLLLKYGFTETFQRYLGHVPVVGDHETITEDNYPDSDWLIISTAYTRIKPPGVVEDAALYKSSNIRVAVRKDRWDQATISFISEFFYVIDHFPQSVTVDSIDNTNTWMILMGHILVGGQYTVGRIFSRMGEHLSSLDDFVDEVTIEKLGEKGFEIRDFYDLAAMLVMRFPSLLAENDRIGNIYEKYYDIQYHALKPVTYALTQVRYDLIKSAQKSQPSANNVNTTLQRKLKPRVIFNLSHEKIVAETVSYSGDHWYFRLTSKVSEQEKAAAAGQSSGRGAITEANFLDVSMIEGGSMLFLPKNDPTPVGNINPYVRLNMKTGSIIPNPDLVEVLARTKLLLDKK